MIGKTEEWLLDKLKKQGIENVEQIFYCSFEKDQVQFQLKEKYQ